MNMMMIFRFSGVGTMMISSSKRFLGSQNVTSSIDHDNKKEANKTTTTSFIDSNRRAQHYNPLLLLS